jgi:hypothetical protein
MSSVNGHRLLAVGLGWMLAMPLSGFARENGRDGAEFLRIGAGARARALGGSYTAVTDDAASLFWNPAALALVARPEMAASHVLWAENIRLSHAAYAHPVRQAGSLALGVAQLDSGNVEGRDEWDRPTGVFRAPSWGLTAGLGTQVSPSTSLGVNTIWVHQAIQGRSDAALAMDAGALMRTPWPSHTVTWAVVLKNAGGKIGPGREAPLPTALHLGVSDWLVRQDLLFSLEGVWPRNGSLQIRAGGEVVLASCVSFRAGYGLGGDTVQGLDGLSLGLGLSWPEPWTSAFDYSYGGAGGLGAAHAFSVSMGF